MTQEFDKDYWESHWQEAKGHGIGQEIVPNPYLARETSSLVPGSALDAGCGEGAEAILLAAEGWQVTAADISAEVLSRASERATKGGVPPERVQWVEADLSAWEPGTRFDLVTTHYAHPAMPQLAFYERISDWVAPAGTLLIVGHLHTPETTGHGHNASRGGVGHRGEHHGETRRHPVGRRHRRRAHPHPHRPRRPGGPVARRRRTRRPTALTHDSSPSSRSASMRTTRSVSRASGPASWAGRWPTTPTTASRSCRAMTPGSGSGSFRPRSRRPARTRCTST